MPAARAGPADNLVYDPWLALSFALGSWLLLSVAIERVAMPRPVWRDRPHAAWCIHLASALLCYALVLAASRRPVFATIVSAALWALLIAVNNAKFRALREPFVYSDFALFSQAFRFPRLYLPFLNGRQAFAGAVLSISGSSVGLWAEPSLADRIGPERFVGALVVLLAVSALLLVMGIRSSVPLRFEPNREVPCCGLLATLWLYRVAELSPRPVLPARSSLAGFPSASRNSRGPLPNLIVVQSESFFDARRMLPAIRPEILQGYDRVREASLSGRLAVPAWGANTMRTEFAFLSGIPAELLGVHRFNPFRRYALQPLSTIAHVLRTMGYRTVCIHPHPIGFFGRDRVYPRLGFDRFIDIEGFHSTDRFGPYIRDAAVTAKIVEVLATESTPVFLFAITMENHGPLHLEGVSSADEAALYASVPPPGFDDLTVYLRHLANADRMVTDLVGHLAESKNDGALCFFGDHVPAMPNVYRQLAYTDARTDYLIWRRGSDLGQAEDLSVDTLGMALLAHAELIPKSAVL